MAARGYGVAGGLDRRVLRGVAEAAERAGYGSFWVNDTPDGDGLAALAEAAGVTRTLRLAVGVIPLDRVPAERIAARIRELGLPAARLTVGVGSGRAADALRRVERGVRSLRDDLDAEARVVVGALGPRMAELAGRAADGALLNWSTPPQAAASARAVRAAAATVGADRPLVIAYVRVSLSEGTARLRAEAARYAAIPSYAAHFGRTGISAIDTCVSAQDAQGIADGLAPFQEAVDEVVVRAMTPGEDVGAYLALLGAARPR